MEETTTTHATWTDDPPGAAAFDARGGGDAFETAPAPSIGVLAWLRSRARAHPATGRRALLVDPRSADDAVTLRRWGCEVTAMFSHRETETVLRDELAAEGVACIAGDFFDLESSWRRSIDLVVMDMGPLPKALRLAAIRLFTECLAETGRMIVTAPEHSGLEESVRAAAPLLMMLSSENTFDPRTTTRHPSTGIRETVVAERTGVAVRSAPLPAGIRRFPV